MQSQTSSNTDSEVSINSSKFICYEIYIKFTSENETMYVIVIN